MKDPRRYNFQLIIVMMIFVIMAVFASSQAACFEVQEGRLNSRIRMRQEPSLEGKVLLYVMEGQTVSIIDATKTWYKVKFKKGRYWQVGWMVKEYIDIIPPPEPVEIFVSPDSGPEGTIADKEETPSAQETTHPETNTAPLDENQPQAEIHDDIASHPVAEKENSAFDTDLTTVPASTMDRKEITVPSIQKKSDTSPVDGDTVHKIADAEQKDLKIEERNDTDAASAVSETSGKEDDKSQSRPSLPGSSTDNGRAVVNRSVPDIQPDSKPTVRLRIHRETPESDPMCLPVDNSAPAVQTMPIPQHQPRFFLIYIIISLTSVLFALMALIFAYKAYSLGQTILKFSLKKRRQKIIIGDDQYEKIEEGLADVKQRLIQVDFRIEDSIFSGFIYQLSAYMASIYTSEIFVAGKTVQLSYCDPDDGTNIRREGRIIGTSIQGIEILFSSGS